jgi:hypothetical protein
MVLGCSLAAAHPGAMPLGFGGYVGSSLIETTLSAESEVSPVLLVEFPAFVCFFALLGQFLYLWIIFLRSNSVPCLKILYALNDLWYILVLELSAIAPCDSYCNRLLSCSLADFMLKYNIRGV